MGRAKIPGIPLVLLILVGLSAPAASLQFRVKVSELTDHGFYNLQNAEDERIQRINGTVENLGSIGCRYRLRAEFNRSGVVDEVWSPPAPLWPGESAFLELQYVATNYTGQVETQVFLEYCGLEENISSFTYQVERRHLANGTLETEVLESNLSSAEVRTTVKEGYMVPVNPPGGWKVSSARVRDSRAQLNYEAPIFSAEQKLSYVVINQEGETVGTTTFDLETRKTIIDTARKYSLEAILLLSLLLNLLLLSHSADIREKLKL